MNGRAIFICGLLISVIASVCFFMPEGVEASSVAHDLRFAQQLGLYDSVSLSRTMLARPISEAAFYRGFTRILTDLGFLRIYSFNEMQRLGIMKNAPVNEPLSRRQAVESLFRAIIYGIENNKISNRSGSEFFQPFQDWIIEEKYMQGLNVAIKEGIITGMNNGRFGPDNFLKTSDALTLFRRFYQAVEQNKHQPEAKINISPEVKVSNKTVQIKKHDFNSLHEAGAFLLIDDAVFADSFAKVRIGQLAALAQGILQKHNKQAYLSELKYYMRSENPEKLAQRKHLAFISSILLRGLVKVEYGTYMLYSDVKPHTALFRALDFLGRAGMVMGYADHRLVKDEYVTIGETLSLMQAIVLKAREFRSAGTVATRDDIEAFKELLKSKRARIKRILDDQAETENCKS